jgi:glycogen operon protein
MTADAYSISRGSPHPLGPRIRDDGINFSVFSEHATSVTLVLFDPADHSRVVQASRLDRRRHYSSGFWHVFVHGAPAGVAYGFLADGPSGSPHAFDAEKLLLDPYAPEVSLALLDRQRACVPGSNVDAAIRGIARDLDAYDWEGDRPLHRPLSETVIYEMHVGGFTRSPTSGVRHPGTYAGVIEKIPHLVELGITAVELLPTFAFDHKETRGTAPDGSPLVNYWGYDPLSFFAPHPGYASGTRPVVDEFRDMVKALHRAGIEVILDVVFNHTGEGNHQGPVFGLKGLANQIYYAVQDGPEGGPVSYLDFTGCGNTVNANHPITEQLLCDSLVHWVTRMHVDGFRFDEASVLARAASGTPLKYAPIVWRIEMEPELAETKIIAEPWDAGGLYQLGGFPSRWSQWNGKFRDDVRRFVRGDPGIVGNVAARISGSADLFGAVGELPTNSVNFVTAHDGFTLNDLVSYNDKHNEANGEDNRDGIADNMSWNCGAEGETDRPDVNALRRRQIKNFLTILAVSQGVPMILAGDELRRTQAGNNNGYCHDSPLTWLDWSRLAQDREVFEFLSGLLAFRRDHESLRRSRFFDGDITARGRPDVSWHGCELNKPGWDDPSARAFACTLGGLTPSDPDLHLIFNMHWEELYFEIPRLSGRQWSVVVDTAAEPPGDVPRRERRVGLDTASLPVAGRSCVVLETRPA